MADFIWDVRIEDNFTPAARALALAAFKALLALPIAPKEREAYPHHTDSALIGIRAIHALESDALRHFIGNEAAGEQLRAALGSDTNPSWVRAQLAEELFRRDEIDAETYDRLAN